MPLENNFQKPSILVALQFRLLLILFSTTKMLNEIVISIMCNNKHVSTLSTDKILLLSDVFIYRSGQQCHYFFFYSQVVILKSLHSLF